MQIVDLTQTLSPQMPVYPGTAPPVFEVGCSLEADGSPVRAVAMLQP